MNFDELCDQVLSDPVTRSKLAAALRRQMLGDDDYISMTDGISLRNWLCQLYSLPISDFDDIYIKDLKKLGYQILEF